MLGSLWVTSGLYGNHRASLYPPLDEVVEDARQFVELAVERGSIGVILELLLLDSSPFGRLCDLHLMVVTGGRERTGDEYSKLLRDTGFSLVRVQPTNSIVSMLVVEAT
mgnify:CR=1 FL=1